MYVLKLYLFFFRSLGLSPSPPASLFFSPVLAEPLGKGKESEWLKEEGEKVKKKKSRKENPEDFPADCPQLQIFTENDFRVLKHSTPFMQHSA